MASFCCGYGEAPPRPTGWRQRDASRAGEDSPVVALSGSFISSCPNRLNSRLRRKTGNLRPIGIHVRFGSKSRHDDLNSRCPLYPQKRTFRPRQYRAALGLNYQRMVARAGVAAKFTFLVHSHMLRHACGFKRSGNVIAIPESGLTAHVKENAVALSLTLTPQEIQTLDAAHPPPHR
jgi:hypothetical protein